MSIAIGYGGYWFAECDACCDDCTDQAWEDPQDCADEVGSRGGFVHTQMWNEMGTSLVLCLFCHRDYSRLLSEVESDRLYDGDVFALWAAKGWAHSRNPRACDCPTHRFRQAERRAATSRAGEDGTHG